ncbi:2-C-methyl-D-erythritol 2,4-cyclodiphosphate synthase [Gynuella sp.]|uniref:2-C-methyl-D-erythritol 2,4-cyclodiphosphate synthase n=1 Tax=Gynuella sp. TaxID=2969146 RepID=UPI003D0DC814
MRVGHGFDVHRFDEETEPDKFIVLGGVKIPCHAELIAHSDGDVLVHAICDAVLGAAALGDIGRHFPDTDDDYKSADSLQLLRHCCSLVSQKQLMIGNIDSTIVAQTPKMAPHIESMRKNIAACVQCDVDRINVKATTTEHLGYTGRKEGIAAHAVVLLVAADHG